MNIVFLDIDGPMIPYVTMRYHPDNYKAYPGETTVGERYWKFCERAIAVWSTLYKTRNFKTVISSTWRKHYPSPHYFHDLFKTNGLEIDLHDDWCTPTFNKSVRSWNQFYECSRATEINNWILNHTEMTDYIILDDEESGHSLKNLIQEHSYMQENMVLVDPDAGLSSGNIGNILSLTGNWMK